jgi:hypothetical protein
LANFVGIVVGFGNVCKIRLRCLLLAAALSFESEIGIMQLIPVKMTGLFLRLLPGVWLARDLEQSFSIAGIITVHCFKEHYGR